MRLMFALAIVLTAGCASQSHMGDRPPIGPSQPAADVTVEMEGADTVCVTENGIRTCVPRVDQSIAEDDS